MPKSEADVPIDRAAVIDEYGELDRKVREFKPVADRHKAVKAQIDGWYAEAPADRAYEAHGQRYTVQVGARGFEREVSEMPWLYRWLGKALFLAKCKFGVGDVDKLVDAGVIPKAKLPLFLKREQTGPRKIEVVAKAGPAGVLPIDVKKAA